MASSKKDTPSETLHIFFRRSLKLVIFQLIVLYGMLGALLIFLFSGINYLLTRASVNLIVVGASVSILMVLFVGMQTIISILSWRSEYYVIEFMSITHTWGILKQSSETHSLSQNCTIEIRRSLLGLLLNYGTIILRKDSSLHTPIILYAIPHPDLHCQYLKQIINTLPSNDSPELALTELKQQLRQTEKESISQSLPPEETLEYDTIDQGIVYQVTVQS